MKKMNTVWKSLNEPSKIITELILAINKFEINQRKNEKNSGDR